MNFDLTDEHKLIKKTANEFAKNELLPGAVDRDRKKIWPQNQIRKMSEFPELVFPARSPLVNPVTYIFEDSFIIFIANQFINFNSALSSMPQLI